MNKRYLALFALIVAPIFGAQGGTLAKLAFRQFTPWSVICLRHFIACIILFPILIMQKQVGIKKKDLLMVVCVSLFWCGNVIFYTFGIQYTTVIMSQVMYFFSPLFVLLLSRILYKQQFSLSQYAGIILSIIGGLLIFTETFFGNAKELISSLGTFHGNMITFIAVVSFSLYLIYSKKVTTHYSVLSITAYSALAAFIISFPFLINDLIQNKLPLAPVGIDGITGVIGQALVLSILMIFTYQYTVKHISPYAASSVIYIGPLGAALTAIPLFEERISSHLLLSGLLIGIGVYFAAIRPLLQKEHKL